MRLYQLIKNSTTLTLTFGVFNLIRAVKNQEEINNRLDRIENLIQKTGNLRESLDKAITEKPETVNSIPEGTVNDLLISALCTPNSLTG